MSRYSNEWYQRNREWKAASNRAWKAANPDKIRRIARRTQLARYGLTPEDYDRMLVQQGGVCAICGAVPGSPANHGHPNLAVDHHHTSKVIRGLLCLSCNGALGLLGERNLGRAMAYALGGYESMVKVL